jgi:hypothetical protein
MPVAQAAGQKEKDHESGDDQRTPDHLSADSPLAEN